MEKELPLDAVLVTDGWLQDGILSRRVIALDGLLSEAHGCSVGVWLEVSYGLVLDAVERIRTEMGIDFQYFQGLVNESCGLLVLGNDKVGFANKVKSFVVLLVDVNEVLYIQLIHLIRTSYFCD